MIAQLSPKACILAECKRCLGMDVEPQQHYDCRSAICPLYPAHPFRGLFARKVSYPGPERSLAAKAQPSRKLIRLKCEQCQEGSELDSTTRQDCGMEACGLYPLRACQKGGVPKNSRLGRKADHLAPFAGLFGRPPVTVGAQEAAPASEPAHTC